HAGKAHPSQPLPSVIPLLHLVLDTASFRKIRSLMPMLAILLFSRREKKGLLCKYLSLARIFICRKFCQTAVHRCRKKICLQEISDFLCLNICVRRDLFLRITPL
ncbi:hypothetical protein, partial [Burkholderia multivorans]|uniref:hypothetical protein n=1 Tax=Burkholderia multivorans TaxID=87883 RepID=UPI001C612F16